MDTGHPLFDVETIVVNPERFKASLHIGEEAYTTLRLKNKVVEAWDTCSFAASVAAMANSPWVATTFFARTGVMAFLGLTAPATPIGWVIAAAVLSGGGWYAVTRKVRSLTSEQVATIPKFINTPIDVLALGYYELVLPMVVTVARADGEFHASEEAVIRDFFVEEWGYDRGFIDNGFTFIRENMPAFPLEEYARNLAVFLSRNRDCNQDVMKTDLQDFLRKIMRADGQITSEEEAVVAVIEKVLAEQLSLKKRIADNVKLYTWRAQSSAVLMRKATGRVGKTAVTKIRKVFPVKKPI